MSDDPVRGKKIKWTYSDGPVKGMLFEHAFGTDGTVTWRDASGTAGPTEPSATYQAMQITPDVYAVTYLASSGWTLTTVVDSRSGKIVSVASNEKQLVVQHGTLA
jgi:hypothetical protein